jgi:Prokaryotic RING finger family 4
MDLGRGEPADSKTPHCTMQVLPCGHGVCTHCFESLVAREARLTVCPLCRTRVLTPTPQEAAAAAAAAAEAQATAAARMAAAAAGRRSTADSAR